MKAAIYNDFQGSITIEEVPDPKPLSTGVVIKVEATGICRSDWHGWMGHDADIGLPHVPGHELAGTIAEVGSEVKQFKVGDRITLPFVCGCGHCSQCVSGNAQICDHQFQPGFTHWGSFAEYVGIHYAEQNLVKLPKGMDYNSAASLGCRFVTSFRAIVDQGKIKPGEWLAVHGCGGVGLSAIMIAKAYNAKVIAIDINEDQLDLARELGADITVNAAHEEKLIEQIKSLTGGGANLSIDALGSRETCYNSVKCLKKQGRHIQVGLLAGAETDPQLPMGDVVANELQIIGSHGIQATRYSEIFKIFENGLIHPAKLIQRTVDLATGVEELMKMNSFKSTGITIINNFS